MRAQGLHHFSPGSSAHKERGTAVLRDRYSAQKVLVVLVSLSFVFGIVGCGTSPEEKRVEADWLFQQAVHLHDEGAYRKSEELFLTALRLDEDIERRGRIGDEYYYLGLLQILRGRYADGLRFYTKALQQYRMGAERKNEVAMLNYIARVLVDLGDEKTAIGYLEEALTIGVLFDDPSSRALAQLNLARVFRKLGNLDQALQSFQQSRALYATLRDSLGLRTTLEELGRTYLELGRYAEAARSFTRALDYVVGDKRERSLFLTRVGIAQRKADDARSALRSLDEAHRLALSTGAFVEERILVMANVGHVYFDSHSYEKAREFYQSALRGARKAGKKSEQGYLLLLLSDVEREMLKSRKFVGSLEKAVDYATEASQLFSFLYFRRGEAAAKYRLGLLTSKLRDRASAVQFFKEAVELEEDNFILKWDLPQDLLLDPGLFNDYSIWYDSFVETLLKLQRTEEALWYLERKLQHRFQLLWNEVGPRLRKAQTTAGLESLRTLRRHIGLVEKDLVAESAKPNREQNAERIEELQTLWTAQKGLFYQRTNELSAQSPNLEWLVKTTAASLPDIQSALPDSTALIEFVLGEDAVSIILVTRNLLAVRNSPARKQQILRSVARVRDLIGKGEEDIAVESLMRDCYRSLLQPLERSFSGLRRLIIVPPPELEGFPFHACLQEREKRGGPFIVARIGIHYLPLAAALVYNRSVASSLSRVFAVGNASGAEWDVEYEFKDMRSFFPKISLIMGKRATLDHLTELRGDMLHLSSEFSYDARNPENSSFKLANGESRGTLSQVSLASLSSLRPFTLVVFSNQDEQPYGVNLAHAQLMLLGGSRYVIANLWPHDRRASKRFKDLLFTAMLEGYSIPEAFQQAQVLLSRKREFSTPRLWALFFLFGV